MANKALTLICKTKLKLVEASNYIAESRHHGLNDELDHDAGLLIEQLEELLCQVEDFENCTVAWFEEKEQYQEE